MENLQENFNNWLNELLKDKPFNENTMAINFNIYNMKKTFDVQLIGSIMYDENNDDWACEESYTSGENCLFIKKSKELDDKELALECVMELINNYLNSGEYANYLKQYVAICAGFVDDEIECVWCSDDEE